MGIVPGDLRYSITVQELTVGKDIYGGVTETYNDILTLRCNKKELSGDKVLDSDEIFTAKGIQFTTYYRPTVTPTCRILFEGRFYRVLSITEIGFRAGLQINSELINE